MAGKFKITVSLQQTKIMNSLGIWVYPALQAVTPPAGIKISYQWDQQTKAALAAGEKVVLLPHLDSSRSLIGSFLPDSYADSKDFHPKQTLDIAIPN